ncbi:hypothetical protein N7471_010512 [Penicillium samsonianum]|uniref:uncharacterized protein n=1 Tax=Penicillium samsonianum TaxID=1882272 RepID=UPI00254676D2|nr:uncharacterized protein N7471_010512 [Penicillium samsonianum]KAJ6126019.1 hypothetical protein N7471_010512 [Penicillium samsonianum]
MPPSLDAGDRAQQLSQQINNKITQFQLQGLTFEDRELLRARLPFVWRPHEIIPAVSATKSRQSRSRYIYSMIQDASNHLFLAVVLVVPPTVCISPAFQLVLNSLMSLETYVTFQFQLNAKAQRFFESTAAEQGFATERRYLSFMKSMFSAPEARQIQLAYSLVARDSIEIFMNEMLQGVVTSEQWAKEGAQGGDTTGCVTIFIPSNQHQDASCTIRVNRDRLVHSIHKFNMTKLKLE